MVLAPADFYAYSRATGVPVPEDPEERAQIAPEVLAFRRNQLVAPREESNLLQNLGLAAAGLGLAGLGAFGARRLLRRQPAAAEELVSGRQPSEEAVRQVAKTSAIGNVVRDLNQPPTKVDVEPSKTVEPVQQSQPTQRMVRRHGRMVPAETVTRPSLSFPRSYLEEKAELAPETLVTNQQALAPLQIDQAEKAVDTGIDQAVARFGSQPEQRDIYLTRTGDSSAQRFLAREREEIASELGEQNIIITPSRVEKELALRLTTGAHNYGPKYTARKQALELYAQTGSPVLLEKVTRFGLSPVTFNTFENMPTAQKIGFESSPPFSTSYYPDEELIPITRTSNIEVDMPGMGRVNLAELRKPVVTEDTALAAEGYYQETKNKALDWLGKLRVELEPKRNKILKERRYLAEQRANEIIPQLQAAESAGYVEDAANLENELQVLRQIWRNPTLGSHRQNELRSLNARISKAQQKIQDEINLIQKKYPTTIKNWSGEANRVFGELDVDTGEFIPETMELRSERKMVDTESKGGGGRNVAEFTAGERLDEEIRKIQGGGRIRDYDPETGAAASSWTDDRTQTGRNLGIYGIQPSDEKQADPTKRPSQPSYSQKEIESEALRLSQSDPYGDVPVPPDYEDVIHSLGYQEPTEAARRSVLMSLAIQKQQRMQANRNPRGGILPDEITTLRRQLEQINPKESSFDLPSILEKQLEERNRFALEASSTPGGTVRRGALNLGSGLGIINAGIESLPSESATIQKYGVTGSQLKEFGDVLMARAAYKRGLQPGPTEVRVRVPNEVSVPTGSIQSFIPGIFEGSPMAPRGYTPNAALDFYEKALAKEASELAAKQPKERLVRRQGRMVPLSQLSQPYQRNLLYPNG